MSIECNKDEILAAALEYARKGYPVVACYGIVAGSCTCGRLDCHKGKHPIPSHGHLDATTDEEVIRRWWGDHPWANVAIRMGDSIWVAENDPRNGGDTTLAELVAKHGPIPTTPTVRSGGGGEHRYFRLPNNVVVKSRPIAKGIDAKGSGLCVAPPSNHVSGRRYEWVVGLDMPLADAPDWLLALAGEGVPQARGVAASDGVNNDGFVMGSSEPNDFASHPGAVRGARNDTIMRLLGIHLARGDSLATIEAMALSWAKRCDPPIPEKEVRSRLWWAEGKRGIEDGDSALGGQDGETAAGSNGMNEPTRCDSQDGVGSFVQFVQTPHNEANGPTDGRAGGPIPTQPPPLLSPSTEIVDDGVLGSEDRMAAGYEHGLVIVNDTAVVTPADDWPSLHPDALYGLPGDIVRAIEPETEADPAGILLSLLTAVGNVVGRTARFQVGAKDHHANLYAALVGDTASGKGVSWSVVEYLMMRADRAWTEECVDGGLTSGEGLIERVRDDDPDEGGQGTFEFAMPKTKRFLAVETEFSRIATAMRREGCTLSEVMRSAWDGDVLATLTRSKSGGQGKKPIRPLRASNGHFSIIGHITPEELSLVMGKKGGVDIANGFANRFLWACVRRSKLLPEGGNASVLDAFVGPLASAIADARTRGRSVRTPEAAALWASEYEALTQPKPGAWGLVVGRGRAHVVRLALVYALLDKSEVVDVVHLRGALAVWRYCEASARRLFGGSSSASPGDSPSGGGGKEVPLHLRLCDGIVKNPGVRRTDLLRATGVSTEALGEALAMLERLGLAHKRTVKPEGGGRPGECWYPGPGDDPDDGEEFTMRSDDVGNFPSPDASDQLDELTNSAHLPANGASLLSQSTQTGSGEGDAASPNLNQTPDMLSSPFIHTQSTTEPSETIGEPEFFAEFGDSINDPHQSLLEKPEAGSVKQGEVSMKNFEDMLALYGLSSGDARQGHKLSPRQWEQVRHAADFTLAQVQRRKRERELYGNRMSDEAWALALNEALGIN